MSKSNRAKATDQANKRLTKLETYTADFGAWLDKAKAALAEAGLTVDMSGIYCGEDGRADFDTTLADGSEGRPLHFSWHKMPSGRYEMTAYVS
jgi:hypothetical protein